MKDEIAAAVFFLTSLVKKTSDLPKDLIDQFQNKLTATLLERFKDHWYDTIPSKGQAYRCIRINDNERVDPVLHDAASKSGLNIHDLGLPTELTIWVDPLEVSCRLGENHGAFCTVALFYDGCSENKAKTIDIDKMLSNHFEKQQADFAKFVKATSNSARIKHRISPDNTRMSPPVTSAPVYSAGPPPPCHGMGYPNMGWEEPRNGYHGGERFYGPFNSGSGEASGQGSQVTWGNWESSGEGGSKLSPNSNSVLCDPSNVHLNTTKNKPSRLVTGGSHLSRQSNFSSHSGNKFRWVKPTDAAQA